MKKFVLDLMTKPSKKALSIIAVLIGILAFIIGILTICRDARSGCGEFINELITAVIFFILAFEISKGDKKKSIILLFAIVAEFIFLSFGHGIQSFVICAQLPSMGIPGVDLLFGGLGAIAFFVAVALILFITLNENVKKENFIFASNCAFIIAALFYFIRAILDLCQSGNGLDITTSVMINIYYVIQALFFAFETNHLLMKSEEKTEVKE